MGSEMCIRDRSHAAAGELKIMSVIAFIIDLHHPPSTPPTPTPPRVELPLTSLEVEEEPAIAEVEVRVVAVLMHVLKQLGVQDLPTKR